MYVAILFFLLDSQRIKTKMNIWMIITTILLLVLLTQLSKTVKYHVKYICFHIGYIFLAFICSVFFILHKPGSSQNLFIIKYFIELMKFEWLFGFKIEIEGQEILMKAKKPFVVASNHQTAIDPLILVKCSPNGTAPLAKKILLYVPIFGQVSWLCGTVFINRKKGKSAIEIMKKVGRQMKEKLTSLWIFPEGTRYQLDKVMPFKKGAFHLAIQAQVPLIPVVICNYRNVIDCNKQLFEGGVIRVKCLQPIDTTGLTADDVNNLCERAFQQITDVFEKDLENNSHLYSKLS